MKKIISTLLAVAMIFSIGMFANLGIFSTKASALNVGDIVEFGLYPQSEVKDSATISALNSQTLNWISYGYFNGRNTPSDYMKFADVTYNGEKYRAVEFTEYRPSTTRDSVGGNDSYYQQENGYNLNTVYWFKYEPIKWRVLDPSTGFVLSEICIDSQA